MKTGGHNRKLGNAEIALAMELRQAGCKVKLIAYGLGVADTTLTRAMTKAKREGMS